MSNRVKITKKVVEGLSPSERDVIVWDNEIKGFGIKVTPTGKRSYILFYRNASGQQRKPTIGQHGAITAEQARTTAKLWLADVTKGVDVSRVRSKARTAPTVADLADRYLTEYAELHKKPRSVATDRSNLRNHVLPLLGKHRVVDVTRSDIDSVKIAVKEGKTARSLAAKARGRSIIKGGPGIANRVVALLSKMFACAVEWEMRETNPAQGVRKFKEQRKDRFLDTDEIVRLHQALDEADTSNSLSPYATAAIRVLLLTGLRLGEVRDLTWEEVDVANRMLRLKDTKTGKRNVPINNDAFEIIMALPQLGAEARSPKAMVFPSLRTNGPMSLTRPWYAIRLAANISDDATIHTLRHTFASFAVMGGLTLPQVGALLGHKSTQTTLRYADHMTEAVRGYSQLTAQSLKRRNSKRES